MSDYNVIRGLRIKYLSADPPSPEDGQVWYNSTTSNLRVANVIGAGAWSSGGATSAARYGMGGAGTQTAGLVFGGSPTTASTEEYNGSSWTGGGNLNYARFSLAGAGTQTSALAMTGRGPSWSTTLTEKYNGSSWTASAASPTALNQTTSTGTQTAALLWGGVPSPGASGTTGTSEFDGSSWTTGGSLPSNQESSGGFGTQTAGMRWTWFYYYNLSMEWNFLGIKSFVSYSKK